MGAAGVLEVSETVAAGASVTFSGRCKGIFYRLV